MVNDNNEDNPYQENEEARHGLDDESGAEDLTFMDNLFRVFYNKKRHGELHSNEFYITKGINPTTEIVDWRLVDKQKTVSVALVLCLNIGVDPPDVVKTSPCAKLECWIDPFSLPANKALEAIGKNLQQQYEIWQPRARYKQFLDPTVEDTKKLCCSLRRSSKDERILFHYNGHGVPKPTSSGEIWVFNKTYTQYIPISILDLQSWLGSPCMYVYDCSSAGNIIKSFNRFSQQLENENYRLSGDSKGGKYPNQETIHFAACDVNETLPMSPDLPADLFSACLTTPIEMAMRWFVIRNPLKTKLEPEMVLKLPGRLNDRRTPLGDLSWVFTSITDSIAWSILPHNQFIKLFRQDLMMAALFRNFLLADRIMRSLKCHPISIPKLPSTHNHPLWKSWDMALDFCLSQLPALIEAEATGTHFEYQGSPFFTEQLVAFEIWLGQAAVKPSIPEQLPIVLQVLLSQVHRGKALILLSRFFDLGLWAVNAALLVGIFPYVLKLLQSPAIDLKPSLTFIWSRILPVDNSCQADLVKDNGYMYFLDLLKPEATYNFVDFFKTKTECCVILSFFCRDHMYGKQLCMKHNILNIALAHLNDPYPQLRQWTCLMLGQVWKSYDDAKWSAIEVSAHEKLLALLQDNIPEVRASALFSLSTLFDVDLENADHIVAIEHNVALSLIHYANDGSPIVRKEWVVLMSHFIYRYKRKFVNIALEVVEEEKAHFPTTASISKTSHINSTSSISGSEIDKEYLNDKTQRSEEDPNKLIYALVWKSMLILTLDCMPQIAQVAQSVVDQVHYIMIHSKISESFANVLMNLTPPASPIINQNAHGSPNQSPQTTTNSRRSQIANTLRRSASYSLRSLYSFGSSNEIDNTTPIDKGSSSSLNTLLENSKVDKKSDPVAIKSSIDKPGGSDFVIINSYYFDWSAERFREPHVRVVEDDEPGSIVYHQRMWRRNRNDKVIAETEPQQQKATTTKWTTEFKVVHNDYQPNNALFHKYEHHLVISDEKNFISIWDWNENTRLNKFHLSEFNTVGISSLKFINEEDDTMLAVATNDGNIHIYKNYVGKEKQVSGFRGHNELQMTRKTQKNHLQQNYPGIIMEWQQTTGNLIIGGEPPTIRIWDISSEKVFADLPTRSTIGITSISSDRIGGHFIVAGFHDGTVRAYDSRLNPRDSMVKCWREHHSTIVGCHMQIGSNRELVTASSAGEIKLWDIRLDSSIRAFTNKIGITSLAVHDQVPLVATGTAHNGVSVYTMTGQHLGTTFHYQGSSGLLLSQRIAPINSLSFHPSRMMLASITGGGVAGPWSSSIDKSTNITLSSWDLPVIDQNPDLSDSSLTSVYNYVQIGKDSL